jgi:hypothetical protein
VIFTALLSKKGRRFNLWHGDHEVEGVTLSLAQSEQRALMGGTPDTIRPAVGRLQHLHRY